jgi:hypothetical protein
MVYRLKTHLLEILIVFVIAVITTFLTTPKLTSRFLYRPAGHVFVGMPGYFEDFYYYLDQFNQGKEGRWTTENRFSTERFPPTLIYFNNLLFGRIGGWFGWESFESYNFFGLLFKFLFMISGYAVIRQFFLHSFGTRIATFLVFLYSTSLPNVAFTNGHFVLNRAVDIFRSENRALARFGTAPNGMFVNFAFLTVFLFLVNLLVWELREKAETYRTSIAMKLLRWVQMGGIVLLFGLMAIGDDVKSLALVTLIGGLIVIETGFLRRIRNVPTTLIWLTFFGAISVVTAAYLYKTVNADPVYNMANDWDIKQYFIEAQSLKDGSFFQGFGLQLPFFIFGYFVLLGKKNRSVFEHAALLLTGGGIAGYLIPMLLKIPVPGFRLIFPATYAFISVLVIYAMKWIAERLKNEKIYVTIFILYLFINGIAFFRGWYADVQPPKEPEYHFVYIPDDIYKGLVYLRTAEPRDGNILASAYTSMDLMIPGLAGRYTYSGHFLTTYKSVEKDTITNKFFFEWVETPGLHEFLKKNNIRFIVVTKYDKTKELMKKFYPFLKTEYENPMITIFRYDI